VESELGKGSTFRVRIPGVPSADGSAVPSVAAETSIAPDRIPGRVLVVDDSPVNRSVLTAHLRRAGIAFIEKACDGAEALSALDSAFRAGHPYDLVLTDFWMPNMNGLELVERLRADKRFQKLPVFAVTADTETNDDSRSRLFTGVLLKPMTYDKLVEVFSSMPA
jgi:CheY-like chemotaxis protein